jgi:hypothetical protein
VRAGKVKVVRLSVRLASDMCSGREDSVIEKQIKKKKVKLSLYRPWRPLGL